MLGKCLKLPGSLTSWLLNEDNALNTLSWLCLCSHDRRTDRSVSQKVAGWQRIGQQHLLGQSRCLQYVRHEWKRLCGRHIPYAVNAYRGEYMMRYSWAEITTASLLQFPWRYKKDFFGTVLLLLHSGDYNNCINFQLLGRQSIWKKHPNTHFWTVPYLHRWRFRSSFSFCGI